MHVVDRLELAAALAGIPEQLLGRYLSDDRLLHVARSDGRRAHAADGHRGAGYPAAVIRLDEHRGRAIARRGPRQKVTPTCTWYARGVTKWVPLNVDRKL